MSEETLDAMWRRLNHPKRHPTPQVVVDAVVRCGGIGALTEPDNVKRIERCDAEALAAIKSRIAAMRGHANDRRHSR
jgi:mRNA-degrading endonuclease toxin of MazEF toxin-antitoxin module